MKAIIIGGGIIGLSSAYYLRKSGWDVTIIDKTDLSDNCSYGNLGMIVPSHFVPLAAPGMLAQGIRWMFNKRSPFYVKPSLNPELISWGLKFIKSATKEKAEAAAESLLHLNLLSKELYKQLAQESGFDFAFEEKGIIMYYKTEKVGEEEMHLGEKARCMGLDVVALNKNEAQAFEPTVELDVLGGVHYRCDAHLYPNKLIPQLIKHLKAAGVSFILNTEIKDFVVEKKQIRKVITSQGEYEGDVVILAAGSWLSQLGKKAGVYLPLMPGKGYTFTQEQPQKKLNIPAILCEARVAITPMNGHMRFGGTMEIAPVNNRITGTRIEGIVQSVNKYFPNLDLQMPEEKEVWFGFRPCSPDGLPYIGRSKKIDNLVIAGGHAMMGLSLGPVTGKIVSELAEEKTIATDLRLFTPERFS
jgi:D-amino-acid dehydrogenase